MNINGRNFFFVIVHSDQFSWLNFFQIILKSIFFWWYQNRTATFIDLNQFTQFDINKQKNLNKNIVNKLDLLIPQDLYYLLPCHLNEDARARQSVNSGFVAFCLYFFNLRNSKFLVWICTSNLKICDYNSY